LKLLFKTTNPIKLKSNILSLNEDGKLQTWEIYENEGVKYIKHTQQWGEKGVVKMEIDTEEKQLIVKVVKFNNVAEEVKDFEGYYLGRFCKIIFVNFPKNFDSIVNQ
jgi:hypothetical protein